MIGIDDQNGIEAFRRKLWIVFHTMDRHNLRKTLFLCTLADFLYFIFQNILCVHPPFRANTRSEMKCKVASTGSNISNDAPLLDPESVHNLLRFLPKVSCFRVVLSGQRLRRAGKDRQQEKEPEK